MAKGEKTGQSMPDPTTRPARREFAEIGTSANECMALGPVVTAINLPPVPNGVVETATGTLLLAEALLPS